MKHLLRKRCIGHKGKKNCYIIPYILLQAYVHVYGVINTRFYLFIFYFIFVPK